MGATISHDANGNVEMKAMLCPANYFGISANKWGVVATPCQVSSCCWLVQLVCTTHCVCAAHLVLQLPILALLPQTSLAELQ
jgi:hypothetical protein